jgi:hypothetical protein
MHVSDEKIALVFSRILQIHEIFERAQVIADMQSASGLDAGNENVFFHIFFFIDYSIGLS